MLRSQPCAPFITNVTGGHKSAKRTSWVRRQRGGSLITTLYSLDAETNPDLGTDLHNPLTWPTFPNPEVTYNPTMVVYGLYVFPSYHCQVRFWKVNPILGAEHVNIDSCHKARNSTLPVIVGLWIYFSPDPVLRTKSTGVRQNKYAQVRFRQLVRLVVARRKKIGQFTLAGRFIQQPLNSARPTDGARVKAKGIDDRRENPPDMDMYSWI